MTLARGDRNWRLPARIAVLMWCVAIGWPLPARAEPDRARQPWSAHHPRVVSDLARGEPLVVRVVVPLCHDGQVDCGSRAAGKPAGLATNLYWGAVFGARRFLDRKHSGWERVELRGAGDGLLERVVYRRFVSSKRWGIEGKSRIEQLVVLEAVHGDAIDSAVGRLWSTAAEGATLGFVDGERERRVRVHVVGYTGHNRMMDGLTLPESTPKSAHAVPSFVLACYSESYFAAALRRAGSRPLVMTKALMAPEGYVLDAVLKGLGDNASEPELRQRAVLAYAKWQKLSPGAASSIFAKR